MTRRTITRRPSAVLLAAAGAAIVGSTFGGDCQTEMMPPTMDPPTTTPPMNATVSFSQQIQAIFDANCIQCHIAGGIADQIMHLNSGESLAALVNTPSVQNPSLTRVVPGDSASSLIFQKISQDSPPVGSRMPLGGPFLDNSTINLIRDWIDQGALDN